MACPESLGPNPKHNSLYGAGNIWIGPDTMRLWKHFSEHPASVGESYIEHLQHASGFGVRMIGGGLACLLHGLFPFWFEKTGSNQIRLLHDHMVTNRQRSRAREGTDGRDESAKA